MTADATFADLKRSISRPATDAAVYAEGRLRHAVLEPYATPAEVVAALAPDADLHPLTRNGIIAALLAEHRLGRGPVWQTLLLLAYEPMLRGMLRRVGARANPDVSQRLLLAFLEAIQAVEVGRYTTLAIRSATVRAYRALLTADRGGTNAVSTESLDDDDTVPDRVKNALDEKAEAAEVVEALRGFGDPELVRALLATHATAGTLRAYVEETYRDRSRKERTSIYRRLQAMCVRVQSKLRARRARHAA